MDSRQQIKALGKAFRILKVMNQQSDATVSEVAEAVGVPRTTAYRLLETLATEGYVEHQPHSPYYRLTSQVLHLASAVQSQNMLLEAAQPMISDLGRQIGYPVSLSTPRAAEMVTRVTSAHDTKLAIDGHTIGHGVPMLHATTGLCYLAFSTDFEREIVIGMARASGDPLQYLAHHREKLDEVLKRVRTNGFCNFEFAQYREGNLGVPLLVGGRPVGGIVMRYTKTSLKRKKLVQEYLPELTDLASRIAVEYVAKTKHSKML